VTPQPPPGTAPATDNSLGGSPFGKSANTAGTAPPAADPNELKPNAAPDNELKPADTGIDPTLPPPAQVNEIHNGSSSSATADDDTLASDKDISSSKKKKKKGLKKLNPF